MRPSLRLFTLFLALWAFGAATAPPAAAGKAERLVEKARLTVEALKEDPTFEQMKKMLTVARAAFVVPSLLKAGFIIGGEGGSGVLLARDPETETWGYPAFYTMAAASIGLQIGAQASEVVFVIMTDKGLKAMLAKRVKLGVDASVAIGPVGGGVEAATTTSPGADVFAFSRSKGLFGGVSFEGALLTTDAKSNRAFYGKPVSAGDIVLKKAVSNPAADGLREILAAP